MSFLTNLSEETKKLEKRNPYIFKAPQKQTTKSPKEKIEHIEQTVEDIAEMERRMFLKESDDIQNLKKEIRTLKEKADKNDVAAKLNKISFLLAELNSKIHSYNEIKADREKRFAELENKIQEHFQKNFKELTEIDKKIDQLEKQHNQLRMNGKLSSEAHKAIKTKLSEMRQESLQKRAELIDKRKDELKEPSYAKRHDLTFRIPSPPREKNLSDYKKIKHTLLFPKLPPTPKKFLPKKKGLLWRIFHRNR